MNDPRQSVRADRECPHAEPDRLFMDLTSFLNCRGTPEPFRLTVEQVNWFRRLGDCLLAFYRAKNKLYRQSANGRCPTWIARYLDNGKPDTLILTGRAKTFTDDLPPIIRPDVLLTPDGFTICELDSVPGGFGLAARMADCYRRSGHRVVGDITIEHGFWGAMSGGERVQDAQRVAIVVSDESWDYYPEMEWLSQRLLALGHEVYTIHPRQMSYTDQRAFADIGHEKVPVDTVYRFFELFDLPNVSKSELLLYLSKAKRIRLTPPPKAYLEEKMWFALYHHPALQGYWREELQERDLQMLRTVLPPTWILDPTPVPNHAVIAGFTMENHPVQSWDAIRDTNKRNRQMVIKPSGFSELAWGSRGVVVGYDVPAPEWAAAVDRALRNFPQMTYILQEYKLPVRHTMPVYAVDSHAIETFEGRVRLNPYYFVENGRVTLSTILATICSSEKKKIHGMRDAVMTVCA